MIITTFGKHCSVKDIHLELLSLCHRASPSEEASLCSTCSAACQQKDREHLYYHERQLRDSACFRLCWGLVFKNVLNATHAQQNPAGHVWICRVERQNIHLHHCQSLCGCQSYVGCWDFDSWSLDGGLERSGSDRHGAAAFSWSAAGSAGVKSADQSTKCRKEGGK